MSYVHVRNSGRSGKVSALGLGVGACRVTRQAVACSVRVRFVHITCTRTPGGRHPRRLRRATSSPCPSGKGAARNRAEASPGAGATDGACGATALCSPSVTGVGEKPGYRGRVIRGWAGV